MATRPQYGPPIVDFSALGDLPGAYFKGQEALARGQEREREEVFRRALQSGLPRGSGGEIDFGAAADLAARSGNMGGLESFSRLGMSSAASKRADAELGLSRERLDLARQTAQQGKVPFGWQLGPEGTPMPAPGGPHDPAYIQSVAGAKEKPRQFNVSDITKLEEEGGKFSNITRYADTFDPRFAGYKTPIAGNVANTAGRYLPEGVVGKDISQGASWWADYQRSKNIIRNDLFGSALTKTEQSEFEKADVNPGMDPGQIKANLDRQKTIVGVGLRRKANALITAGYDPAVIAAAYGLDLRELGVTAQGRRGAGGAPTQPENDRPEISEARTLIGQGRLSKEDAMKQLRKHKIPFSPGDLDL
jgi:hypothetical protein